MNILPKNITINEHGICVNIIASIIGKSSTVVEIGCYEGQSTRIFAELCDKVIAVDPWKSGYDDNDILSNSNLEHAYGEFKKRTKDYKNIDVIRNTSIQAAKEIEDNSIDAVYIDGEHTYTAVKNDIKTWLPKLKVGGILSGHDYIQGWNDVIKAVDESIGKPLLIFKDGS